MTPSQAIVGPATATQRVRDSAGRALEVRRLTALDKLRLFKAAGPGLSLNEQWLGLAALAACVIAVDDVPVPFPGSEAQIEHLVGRLGDAGLAAVASVIAPESAVDGNAAGN